MDEGPYAFKDDGTAKDPKAFQQALRADPERMAALDSEPEVKRIVLGDDMHAFQEFIKGVYHVCSPQAYCVFCLLQLARVTLSQHLAAG